MDYSVTLPIDLDVLDAHVSNELSGFANIFLEKLSYERVESARGRIVYHVHIQHLGDVGRIKLLKRGPGDTDLETYVVPAEREEWTEENRAAINSVENNLDQNALIIELSNQRDKAANDLTDRRHTILKDMVTGIIEDLYHGQNLPFTAEPKDIERDGVPLNRLEKGIIEAVENRRKNKQPLQDDYIAADLYERGIYNRREAKQYTREYICKTRGKLVRRGFPVDW